MWSMNEPLTKGQIEAILNHFERVGLLDRLNESDGPVDLSTVRELVERLRRAADPESGEKIAMHEFKQAMDDFSKTVRAHLRNP